MKAAVLTMFNGLSSTYSLVNVVAEHLKMLLDAGVPTKVLVSEACPDSDRRGVFAREELEWVKITNRLDGKPIRWRDYSQPGGQVHESFYREADAIARDLREALADVDVCMMHDILYQGWHLVHNVAVRKAQEDLPHAQHGLCLTDPVRHPGPGQAVRRAGGAVPGGLQQPGPVGFHERGHGGGPPGDGPAGAGVFGGLPRPVHHREAV